MNVATTGSEKAAPRRSVRQMTAVLSVVAIGLLACSLPEPQVSYPPEVVTPAATTAQVLEAVKAAERVQTLPDVLAASLSKADDGGAVGCFDRLDTHNPTKAQWFGECAYGDRQGTKLMVIYGDSLAWPFSAPLQRIAEENGYKLRVYGFAGCSVADLEFLSSDTHTPNKECDTYRSAAISQILALHPNLVITTSGGPYQLMGNTLPTPPQLQDAWVSTFQKLAQPGTRLAMIGAIPSWPNDDARCLFANAKNVQACSIATADVNSLEQRAQRAAATTAGVVWVPTIPWVCADRCEPVIADMRVYSHQFQLSRTYSLYLTNVLSEALQPAMH
jgi:hypothetical protein